MKRSVVIAALLVVSAAGCSGSDDGGNDGDIPEPDELLIDGPAQVEDDDGGAVLAD